MISPTEKLPLRNEMAMTMISGKMISARKPHITRWVAHTRYFTDLGCTIAMLKPPYSCLSALDNFRLSKASAPTMRKMAVAMALARP